MERHDVAYASDETQPDPRRRVIVIGAGPGGYVAAIRAAQLGATVTIIERNALGGTCLNVGCVPTKVLLHAAELYDSIVHANDFGIETDGLRIHWPILMEKKNSIVRQLSEGVKTLMNSNGVTIAYGKASFVSPKEIEVLSPEGTIARHAADAFIVATGSVPVLPRIPGIDLPGVLTSADALSLESIPKSVVLVGGGIIGAEFASLFAHFGVRVAIVEMLPEILPNIDPELSAVLKNALGGNGVTFHTGSRLLEIRHDRGGLTSIVETPDGRIEIASEKVLVCVGRKPSTDGLRPDRAGISLDGGRIRVDARMATSVPGIFAVGDCASPIMLAHVASREGEIAAENVMGHSAAMDYRAAPKAVYTSPEIASVGMTEREAETRGIECRIGRFPLYANAKSVISGATSGLVKIVVDSRYGEILGIHIVGPRATDIIAEGALAMRLEATFSEIADTIHAHPTVAEAMMEASMAAGGRAVSLPRL